MASVDPTTPVITLTSEEGEAVPRKTVNFQCGLLRETESFVGDDVELLYRDYLLDFVCDMLTVKFPDHPYGDLLEKVLLFKHTSDNTLVPLGEEEVIEDGTIIEIVLTATAKQEYNEAICSHILRVHTYTGATFCDYCGVILFGLLKQGLRCEGCEKNFHKKCAYKIPNNCTRLKGTNGLSTSSSFSTLPRRQEVWSGRPLWIDRTLHNRPQVPHTFFVHSFKKMTVCHYCKKLLKGVFRQGLRCKDCKMNVHKRCAKEIGDNCMGEVPSLSRVESGEYITRNVITNEHLVEDSCAEPQESRETSISVTSEELREVSPASSSSSQDHLEHHAMADSFPLNDAPMEPIREEDTTSNEDSEHYAAESKDSTDNIKLQRVTGVSLRHTKQPPASVIKEGWMVHYTNQSTIRKKYYWRLDTKNLTFYKSDTSSHYYKEIQLADILAVDPMVTPEVYPLSPPHVFEIVTSPVTYYVGVDMTAALPKDLKPESPVPESAINILGDVTDYSHSDLEELGIGLNVGISWEEALHSALMPITPQASMGSLADIGVGAAMMRPASFRAKRGSLRGSLRGSIHGNRGNSRGGSTRGRKGSMRGSFRVPKAGPPPVATQARSAQNIAIMKPKVETKMDISLFYQIYPEEILGSGQFGTVYGGQSRQENKPVAVKVIDKLRFPNKHESQLRTEVTILQNLSHPGIIHLEQMFETPEKIYVVMEKMNGDMLEMILNSPNSKISERTTKFMVYQILMALQYLHKKDIVHCDLKPENVLLTSETGMPQAKLCDFGFARIIGEKSFRKSIVGTPAYLAPEVLKNEGYNRSLDLWSVGVIIYVSLSGTFPFNEDEEIMDQIQNAAFMFPPDPWETISREAVDLITKMLQVSRKSRYRANQALNHMWLADKKLWEDLCRLEGSLGMRYLTHESEDHFWLQQGAKPHPLAKTEALQKAQQSAVGAGLNMGAGLSVGAGLNAGMQPIQEQNSSSSGYSNNSADLPALEQLQGANGAALFGVDLMKETMSRSSKSSSVISSPSQSPDGRRRDYASLSDEEIIARQAHAERVGYRVSQV